MEFTITIYRPTDKKQINANNAEAKSVKDEEIVALIINNPTSSMQEYANKLQIFGIARTHRKVKGERPAP